MVGGSTETSDVEDDAGREGDDSLAARNGTLSMPGTPRTAERELQLQQQALGGSSSREYGKRASAYRSLSHAPLTTHGRIGTAASASTSDLHSAAAAVAHNDRHSSAKTSSRSRGGRAQSYSTPASQSQSRSHSRTTSRASSPTREQSSSGRASSDAGTTASSSNRCEDVDEGEESEADLRGRSATRREQQQDQGYFQGQTFTVPNTFSGDDSRHKGLSSLAQTALQEESPSPDSKTRNLTTEEKHQPSGLNETTIKENPTSSTSGATLSTSVATIQPSTGTQNASTEHSLETSVQNLATALEPLITASARSGVHSTGVQSNIHPSAFEEAHSQLEALLNRLAGLEDSNSQQLQEELEPVVFSLVEALSPSLGLVDQASTTDEASSIASPLKSIPGMAQDVLQILARNAGSPREVLLVTQAAIETLIAPGSGSGEVSPVVEEDDDGEETDMQLETGENSRGQRRLSKTKKDEDAGKAVWQVDGLIKVLTTRE